MLEKSKFEFYNLLFHFCFYFREENIKIYDLDFYPFYHSCKKYFYLLL